jgi:hypothetical protein
MFGASPRASLQKIFNTFVKGKIMNPRFDLNFARSDELQGCGEIGIGVSAAPAK